MKENSKLIILLHTFAAISISGIAYYFNPSLGRAIFLGSLAFNIYLRMLCFSFSQLKVPEPMSLQEAESDEAISLSMRSPRRPNGLLAMTPGLAALRVIITASIISILIWKFKLNLIGIGIAFVLYQVIFIAVGIYINAYNRRASR